jgi:RNA polymerase sigma factor (TIGR02999 family)
MNSSNLRDNAGPNVPMQALGRTVGELVAGADNAAVAHELFVLLYAELRKLANAQLRRQNSRLALGATTLVHEAYVRMVGRSELRFEDRARFFAYASRAMRALAVDFSRRRMAKKRGRALTVTFDEHETADGPVDPEASLSDVSDVLEELATLDPKLAELVDLHFFGGLSFVEIASLRAVSERTVQRDWHKTRLMLKDMLHKREQIQESSLAR